MADGLRFKSQDGWGFAFQISGWLMVCVFRSQDGWWGSGRLSTLDGWRWAGPAWWGSLSGKGSRGGTAPLARSGEGWQTKREDYTEAKRNEMIGHFGKMVVWVFGKISDKQAAWKRKWDSICLLRENTGWKWKFYQATSSTTALNPSRCVILHPSLHGP